MTSEPTIKRLTVEEFLTTPRGKLTELVDGIPVDPPPPPGERDDYDQELVIGFDGFRHSVVTARIIGKLVSHTDQQESGWVFGMKAGVVLPPNLLRWPDVSYISRERLPDVPDGYLHVPPDLVVEVISPRDTVGDVNRKISEYFAAGVRLVWIVYPDTRQVYVYTAVDLVTIVGADSTLDGGDVLPGFALNMADWFKDIPA